MRPAIAFRSGFWWRRIDGRNEAGAVGGWRVSPATLDSIIAASCNGVGPETQKQPWQWCSPPAAFPGPSVFSEVDNAITSWPAELVTSTSQNPCSAPASTYITITTIATIPRNVRGRGVRDAELAEVNLVILGPWTALPTTTLPTPELTCNSVTSASHVRC